MQDSQEIQALKSKGQKLLSEVRSTLTTLIGTAELRGQSNEIATASQKVNTFIVELNDFEDRTDLYDSDLQILKKNILTLYCQCHGAHMKDVVGTFIKSMDGLEIGNQDPTEHSLLNNHQRTLNEFIKDIQGKINAFYVRIVKLDSLAPDVDSIHNQDALYFNDFHRDRNMIQKDLRNLRRNLKDILTRNPEGILEHLLIAARYLCRICDLTLTAIAWGVDELRLSALHATGLRRDFDPTLSIGKRSTLKSMDETYTPGARTLTGRDHFFNHPQTKDGSGLQLDQAMQKLAAELDKIQAAKFPFKHGR